MHKHNPKNERIKRCYWDQRVQMMKWWANYLDKLREIDERKRRSMVNPRKLLKRTGSPLA